MPPGAAGPALAVDMRCYQGSSSRLSGGLRPLDRLTGTRAALRAVSLLSCGNRWRGEVSAPSAEGDQIRYRSESGTPIAARKRDRCPERIEGPFSVDGRFYLWPPHKRFEKFRANCHSEIPVPGHGVRAIGSHGDSRPGPVTPRRRANRSRFRTVERSCGRLPDGWIAPNRPTLKS
jgi:hypothetical protein